LSCIAFLAVVERAFEGSHAAGGGAASAASATAASAGWPGLLLFDLSVAGVAPLDSSVTLGLLGFPLGLLGLGTGPLGLQGGGLQLGGLQLGGDQSVVLGSKVDLSGEVGRDGAVGGLLAAHQVVLALELLDLLDGDFELMGHPGVGAPLAHPRADLVELGTQRSSYHGRPGD
jgi:hypothetical protein